MKVSIGIPFYNSERTLKAAIQSVFAQTFNDWELLLVDDGSTDNSLSIAKLVDDPRVRVISDGVNRRLPYRLNQWVKLARGEYLARMDADDVMHPSRLECQVEYLDKHTNVDLVGTAIYTIDSSYQPLGKRGFSTPESTGESIMRRGGFFTHPTVMGRKAWFERNPYDERFVRAEDFELWCRTCESSVFNIIPQPLLFYREDLKVNLDNYIKSQQTNRKIIKLYGPKSVGWIGSLGLMGVSYLKQAVYRCSSYLDGERYFVRRRSSSLNDHEIEWAREVIEGVLATKVPGFHVLQM